jgi:(p)ppGpp synthase/HD superfamily hydrolase
VEHDPVYSDRYVEALTFAAALHARQLRKGTRIPYVSHLLAVSALVWEARGDEDQAIAGLLHDAVEDQGGRPVLEEIRARFGDRVAVIVDACSDTDVTPKPPWRDRKESHLLRLQDAPHDALVVVAADKLHNAWSTVADVRADGAGAWERFNAARSDIVWYYRQVLSVLLARMPDAPITAQLREAVTELAAVAGPGAVAEVP